MDLCEFASLFYKVKFQNSQLVLLLHKEIEKLLEKEVGQLMCLEGGRQQPLSQPCVLVPPQSASKSGPKSKVIIVFT
ncbi:hypothetical protein I79_009414 [Cricetulus griseus]|uniref:Uncharacterized protein n=1 Tax=Cricetulus griseus TaxID=10029 RepID=G3HFQ1_CRIGR|nr:hypothetical protein I79_009414 [Cricetulus griseus]